MKLPFFPTFLPPPTSPALELPQNMSYPSTSTPNQSGSNMMQNASGFSLVGGQVVLGNVHNDSTPGGYPQSSTPLPPPSTWDESVSESENYCSQLLRQKRGLPLYIPYPQPLPAEYREHGIQIGDVGSVTPNGEFEFYFNIFLAAEHPINIDSTPEDFLPMEPYAAKDIIHRDYGPGYYLSTSTVQKVDLDPPVGTFPGGHFVFTCDSPQGAVLALPDGAHVQELRKVERMRAYAAKHADGWYAYLKGPRGRELANGDLCLVTGCEKTRSWGMASYHTIREQFQLFFKPIAVAGATYNPYSWCGIHGQRNPSRRQSHDPPYTNEPWNQTTFIHGWSISLPTGLWGRLFGEVQTVSIVDFRSFLDTPDSQLAGGSQGSLFSWALDLFSSRGATRGKRKAGERDVVLSALSTPSAVFNPARLINEYILYKIPQGTGVVMSHDNDWCNVLGDDSDLRLSDFLHRVNDQFDIAEKDGAIFLVSKLNPPTAVQSSERGEQSSAGFGLEMGSGRSRENEEGGNNPDSESTLTIAGNHNKRRHSVRNSQPETAHH
ncbi:hypothetical protein DFH06DRAFT_770591 [Mycena polygramma]|nr:hypothetical protein DFH06DRAFT_770591 [Mycena polygramma]